MLGFKYVIKDELGIHARPAGIIVKKAKEFDSKIIIRVGEREAEATKLMALMSLSVKNGQTVDVSVEGRDEEKAYTAIKDLFENNL